MNSSIHSVPTYDRRIVLTVSPQRGMGTSTVTAALADWINLATSKPRMAVFDPDYAQRTLSCALAESPVRDMAIEAVDWRAARIGSVVDRLGKALCAEHNPAAIALVDCGARSPAEEWRWVTDSTLYDMTEALGIRVTLMLLLDDTEGTIAHVCEFLDTVGHRADYLLIWNDWGNAACNESLWHASPERDRAIYEMGAVEIRFAPLPLEVGRYLRGELDGRPHSLLQAVEQSRDPFVSGRAHIVWKHWANQLNGAKNYLMPTERKLES